MTDSLIRSLNAHGARFISALVVDADVLSFAGFDIRSWTDAPSVGLRKRIWRSEHSDVIEPRVENDVLVCRGSFVSGAAFGCDLQTGWLRIFDLDVEVLTAFRGPLREFVDHPLFAMREYAVASIITIAGTTVLRFACPALSVADLTGRP